MSGQNGQQEDLKKSLSEKPRKARRRIRPFFVYQYERVDVENYYEPEALMGAKLYPAAQPQTQPQTTQPTPQPPNPDLELLLNVFESRSLEEAYQWVVRHQKMFGERTFYFDSTDVETVLSYKEYSPTLLLAVRRCNDVLYLDEMFAAANEVLADDPNEASYLWVNARTNALEKELIMKKYWWGFNYVAYAGYFMWHRVAPKLKLTSGYYFWKTGGTNRSFSRVEILGRLCRAGFDIVDERFMHGELFVLSRKARKPINDEKPNCGPIIKLPRVGQNGSIIGVYKFRTMFSYSEYLQGYVYDHEGLQKGGKLKNDYRVNGLGRFMRRTWIDELPMLANWLIKHNIKLVGVRPLSRHYFSLYTPEMQQLRIQVKPGLIPPFYYDRHTPETIEEVQSSERRYIEAYLKHPFRTDWRYFWGSIGNIIFRNKRSK